MKGTTSPRKALATIVVLAALVATAHGQMGWCRRSAFQVPCAQLEAAKKVWWKQCTGVAQASDFVAVTQGNCCTITQRTRNADTWEFYRKCEHATALYLRSFKPKVGACASVAAKGPCATILPASKNTTG